METHSGQPELTRHPLTAAARDGIDQSQPLPLTALCGDLEGATHLSPIKTTGTRQLQQQNPWPLVAVQHPVQA